MARDIGTDDPRVRVRAPRGTRPRTKVRPDYSSAARARVLSIDRGRYSLLLDAGTHLTAIKARELPHRSIVIGDRVGVVGDLSGAPDTLARIVAVDQRSSALRRSSEDGDNPGVERVIVANADTLAIVTALAHPQPRQRLIDRYLVAAFDAGMRPLLLLTKSDLASPEAFMKTYEGLELGCAVVGMREGELTGLEGVRELLSGHTSVLVGHSGVGKSTLTNALVPAAGQATGHVNVVTGRGRHTSSAARTFELPGGGWVIDTPGIRSFGLAHVGPAELLRGFADLALAAADCPRGCDHTGTGPDCALDAWAGAEQREYRAARLGSYRRLLAAR